MSKSSEPSFSLNEFRSWLSKHKAPKADRPAAKKGKAGEQMVGTKVESRLGVGRLAEKIAEANKGMEPDVAAEVAEAFKAGGGVIAEVAGLTVSVTVGKHTFALPKIYTKNGKAQ